MRARLCILTLVVASLFGCSSDDEPSKHPGGSRAFKTDALPTGAAVYLRQQELRDGKLVIDLVGTHVADGYGVAFRLEYDPAVLSFALATPGGTWTPNHVYVAREARPGLLVGASSEKGTTAGHDWPDTVLGSISFDVRSKSSTRVDFVSARSGVVHADGSRDAAVTWVGGELSAE